METTLNTPITTESEYLAAVGRLREAAGAYYNTDELLMGDDTYDTLAQTVAEAESAHPEWVRSAVSTQVAAGAGRGGDIAHSEPMLSLENVFSDDETRDWLTGVAHDYGGDTAVVVEPKLDGLAVAARYAAGRLEVVITRGDGRTGEDVTANAQTITGLPTRLTEPVDLEVRGEVFMTDNDFAVANERRTGAGKPAFANPRNAAAGTLRVKHDRGYVAPLSFAAYGLVGEQHPTHTAAMARVAALGIATAADLVDGLGIPVAGDAALEGVAALHTRRGGLGFGVDGAVIKLDSRAAQDQLGANSRAPRHAVAYKYPAELAMTRLVDIDVQIGRTGLHTPRAVLEPVMVGGAEVTFATLSNPGQVAAKDVRIGDVVWVRRAGDVVPEITGPNLALRPDGLESWEPPTNCIRCGEPLDRSEARWRCLNRVCGLPEQLTYWCARDCMDIDGVGPALVRALVDAGLVGSIADLYRLTADRIARLDGYADTSAAAAVASIDASKTQPLHRVFCGLGVRMTGRSMSRRIAGHFGSMAAIRAAGVAEFCAIDGIGAGRAESIVAELGELAGLLDELATLGIGDTGATTAVAGPLAGKKVCISGSVPGMSRTEAQEAVEALGGTAVSSVSAKTDVLVADVSSGSSKCAKARQLGVAIMDPAEFAGLAGT